MTKNKQITRIENNVLVNGYPVYQALREIKNIFITQDINFTYASAKEFKTLQSLNQEWISANKPCPVRTSIYVCGRDFDFRDPLAGAFAWIFASRFSCKNDGVFIAEPGGGFKDYAGQPCVWFPEMTGKDILRLLGGRGGFTQAFEPYPIQPCAVSVHRSYRLLNNELNIISTTHDFQTFAETVNADGEKTLSEWERAAIKQITRRLPIVVNVLDDRGSCEILVHDELLEDVTQEKISDPAQIPSKFDHYGEENPLPDDIESRTFSLSDDGSIASGTAAHGCHPDIRVADEYTKMFSVVVDESYNIHVYDEQHQALASIPYLGGDTYVRYADAMCGIAAMLYPLLRRTR